MSSGSDRIAALRRLLDGRFPVSPERSARRVVTGVPALDDLLGGGLPAGALTEIVCPRPGTGGQTCLGALLLATRTARQRMVLVDAANAFDPEGLDDDALAHLVLVRGPTLPDCWRVTDLVVRDPNYAVIVVDVRGLPLRDLLRTRDAVWVRLQRAAEQAGTAVLVQSESAIVLNAALRVGLSELFPADALTMARADLVGRLQPELQRRRVRAGEVSA